MEWGNNQKERLRLCIKEAGGNAVVAQSSAVPLSTLNMYLGSNLTDPKVTKLYSISSACNVSLEWILVGSGKGNTENHTGTVGVPRYSAKLSAGNGHWNEDKETPLDYIPFTTEFLQKKLNRKSTRDLFILEATGDSMFPTISDGGLVLVDERAIFRADGIFAYVQDGMARVKRFRFLPGGVEIVSDNKDLYPPVTISNEEAEQLHIIGRVRWIGHTV